MFQWTKVGFFYGVSLLLLSEPITHVLSGFLFSLRLRFLYPWRSGPPRPLDSFILLTSAYYSAVHALRC